MTVGAGASKRIPGSNRPAGARGTRVSCAASIASPSSRRGGASGRTAQTRAGGKAGASALPSGGRARTAQPLQDPLACLCRRLCAPPGKSQLASFFTNGRCSPRWVYQQTARCHTPLGVRCDTCEHASRRGNLDKARESEQLVMSVRSRSPCKTKDELNVSVQGDASSSPRCWPALDAACDGIAN